MKSDEPSSPRLCRHLRTKTMYVPAQSTDVRARVADGALGEPHCWCNRTMTEIGRDDRPVALGRCVFGRSCFE